MPDASQEPAKSRPMRNHLSPLLAAALEEHMDIGTAVADAMIRDATRERATDIHLDPQSTGVMVRFRVDGTLHNTHLMERESGLRLIRHFRAIAGLDIGAAFVPEDARVNHDIDDHVIDMRMAMVPSIRGPKLSLRLLDQSHVEHRLASLGLGEQAAACLSQWLDSASGGLLVTGPTGSGKTTTLYATLNEINTRPCSIVTIEDPVEYRIDGITQIQVDRTHDLSLSRGLKAMLRLDPDFLMLSEVRDADSARTAIEAACSGRPVLTTLHTRDAIATVTALRNYGLADYEIATSLELVIAQRLVRRLCSQCRIEAPLDSRDLRWLESQGLTPPDRAFVASGCSACQNLGYRGRVGVFEAWNPSEEDYRAILNQVDEHTLRQSARAAGLRSLYLDGMDKIRDGITSVSELRRSAAGS